MNLSIRASIPADLEIFFLHQTDEEANQMAAFTPEKPHDRTDYLAKWNKLLLDPSINMQSILLGGQVIGCVVKFMMDEQAEITYAIAKAHWGKGLTTKAVRLFLQLETTRPIFGRVAFDNLGSQKVLEKTGFIRIGEGKWFANARGQEIEEFIYRLD